MFDVFFVFQHLSRHRYSQIIIKVFIIVCSVPAPSQLLVKRFGNFANAIMPNSQPSLVPTLCSNRHKLNLVPWIPPAYQALTLWQGVLHNQRLQSRHRFALLKPIISYYVKSLPLTHATPTACLCPPCQRFYFYNFAESSCIQCGLLLHKICASHSLHNVFFQCTAIFILSAILPFGSLRSGCI